MRLERFETNFVDLAGRQGLLGQACGRTKANVVAWLDERGQEWKDQVAIVAMDPCRTIRTAPSRNSWSNFLRFSDMTTPHSACLHSFGGGS